MPCFRAGSTAVRHSFAAFSLPGQLIIIVSPRIPAASRERQPRGVMRIDSARMASGMPGTSRCMTAFVASGVMSRLEKPVPPVVTIRQGLRLSAHMLS